MSGPLSDAFVDHGSDIIRSIVRPYPLTPNTDTIRSIIRTYPWTPNTPPVVSDDEDAYADMPPLTDVNDDNFDLFEYARRRREVAVNMETNEEIAAETDTFMVCTDSPWNWLSCKRLLIHNDAYHGF